MVALTPFFWSYDPFYYFMDISNDNPGSQVVADIVKCILLSALTVFLAGKSLTIFRFLCRRRRQGEKGSAGVYSVTSLVLFLLFGIGTILYCTKFLLALKKALCFAARFNSGRGGPTSDWIHCGATLRSGVIRHDVDIALMLAFAIDAQVILSIVNGVLVYRCWKVFADIWAVYVPITVLYVLWIVFSFIEMYLLIQLNWAMPVNLRLYELTQNEFMKLCFALSFILNPTSSIPEGGSLPLDGKKAGYNTAMILLVDAGFPVTLCSFGVLVGYLVTRKTLLVAAFNAQGIFAVLWLGSSVMAPHLIAIHNLRAEAKQRTIKTDIVVVDKFRDPSYNGDFDTLTTSDVESVAADKLRV